MYPDSDLLRLFLSNIKKSSGIRTKSIGDYISGGDEGIVYKYANTRIIKIISYTHKGLTPREFKKLIGSLKKLNLKYYPKIYQFGTVEVNDPWCNVLYYYVTDMCRQRCGKESIAENFADKVSFETNSKLHYDDSISDNVMYDKNWKLKIVDLTTFKLQ